MLEYFIARVVIVSNESLKLKLIDIKIKNESKYLPMNNHKGINRLIDVLGKDFIPDHTIVDVEDLLTEEGVSIWDAYAKEENT